MLSLLSVFVVVVVVSVRFVVVVVVASVIASASFLHSISHTCPPGVALIFDNSLPVCLSLSTSLSLSFSLSLSLSLFLSLSFSVNDCARVCLLLLTSRLLVTKHDRCQSATNENSISVSLAVCVANPKCVR